MGLYMIKKIILFLLFILSISCSNELKNSMGSVILRDEGDVPAVIDNDKKEVIIEAVVNGKYFNTPSRHHGIVFKG